MYCKTYKEVKVGEAGFSASLRIVGLKIGTFIVIMLPSWRELMYTFMRFIEKILFKVARGSKRNA